MMNSKENKVILHFLKRYQAILHIEKHPELGRLFQRLFSREEILEHSLGKEEMKKYMTEQLSKDELFDLMDDDYFILRYLISKLETSLVRTPELSEEEVQRFLDELPIGGHYLRDKAVSTWDRYDRSNYFLLLAKHGKTKEIYAIFSKDVTEEEKYRVTTPPTQFFDTEEEAQEALERLSIQQKLNRDELKVMSLWKIQ